MLQSSYRKRCIVGIAFMLGVGAVLTALTMVAAQQDELQVESEQGTEAQAKQLFFQAYEAQNQCQYDRAIQLFQRALKIQRAVLGNRHRHTAKTLTFQGLLHYTLGQYDKAAPLLEEALTINKSLDESHPDTGDCLNNLALLHYGRGEYAKAVPLYEQALTIFKSQPGDRDPRVAQVMANLSEAHRHLGNYKTALELGQAALDLRLKMFGEIHAETSNSLGNLSVLYSSLGDYATALTMGRKVLEINKAVLGDRHPWIPVAKNNLAVTYQAAGDYAKALPLSAQAVEMNRAIFGPNHPGTMTYLTNLANLYTLTGNYSKAEPLYRQVVDTRKSVLGNQHPSTAESLHSLAYFCETIGDDESALALYQESLAVFQAAFGELHPDSAVVLNNLGALHARRGESDKALPHFELALKIITLDVDQTHPLTAVVLQNLADLHFRQEDYVKALDVAQRAHSRYLATLGDHHPNTALSLELLSEVLSGMGNHDKALAYGLEALEINRIVLGDKHPTTSVSFQNVGRLYYLKHDLAEAEDWFRRSAIALLDARASISQGEFQSVGFATKYSGTHALCAVLARNGKPREAWQWLERSMGSSTWDEINMRHVLSPGEREQLQLLQGSIQQGDKQVSELTSRTSLTKDQQEVLGRWRLEQARRYEELGRLHEQLRDRYGVLAGKPATLEEIQLSLAPSTALVTWVDDISVDEHFAVVLRSSGEPIWIQVPGSGRNGLWTPQDRQLAARFRQTLTSAGGDRLQLAAALRKQRFTPIHQYLEGITHIVALPSEDMLGVPIELIADSASVSYAPSGTIYAWLRGSKPPQTQGLLAVGDPVFESAKPTQQAVPKHGLLVTSVVPASNAAAAGIRMDDVLLSCNGNALNSTADLDETLQQTAASNEIRINYWRAGEEHEAVLQPGRMGLALGNESAPVALAKRRQQVQFWLALRGGDWRELPGTRAEVEALKHRFEVDGQNSLLLTDSAASEQDLLRIRESGELSTFRYLHFATHGEMNQRRPLQSAIILSRDQLPEADEAAEMICRGEWVPDGRLTAAEVLQHWKLAADMVTLSACESGLGRQELGEGYVGFSQAMLLSGARSVVLSLWKVDDTATALLMDRFYENLLGQRTGIQPMSKSQSLAEAKQWIRTLPAGEVHKRAAKLTQGVARGKGRRDLPVLTRTKPAASPAEQDAPYSDPYYWAPFILIGNAD